jgi:hypothetical protein
MRPTPGFPERAMRTVLRGSAIAIAAIASGCGVGEPPPLPPVPAAPIPKSAPAPAPAIAPAAAGRLACNIESVDRRKFAGESLPVAADAPRRVVGWVVDVENRNVPRDAELALVAGDGSPIGSQPVRMWRARYDVVAAKGGNPAYTESGFDVDLDLSGIAPGQYRLVIRSAQAAPTTCDVGRLIQVVSMP